MVSECTSAVPTASTTHAQEPQKRGLPQPNHILLKTKMGDAGLVAMVADQAALGEKKKQEKYSRNESALVFCEIRPEKGVARRQWNRAAPLDLVSRWSLFFNSAQTRMDRQGHHSCSGYKQGEGQLHDQLKETLRIPVAQDGDLSSDLGLFPYS